VLGPGGQIVPGKFGHALQPLEQPEHARAVQRLRQRGASLSEGANFGYVSLPIPEGRTMEPMSWLNCNFCALMTSGENHLRKEVRFVRVTQSKLNLGDFDWTIEFWFMPVSGPVQEGVVFEIGQGPRGENDRITRLTLNADRKGFTLVNNPGDVRLHIPSHAGALKGDGKEWHHLAFVYSATDGRLTHFVDGKKQPLADTVTLQSLPSGEEDYFSIGRDGRWQNPLPGKIDELRFSLGVLYSRNFVPPGSFAQSPPPPSLKAGPPLLFDQEGNQNRIVPLQDRKYLFIDDAIIEKMEHISFVVNPPRVEECVIDSIEGPFRKHVSIIEDEDGLIRMYHGGPDDWFEVHTSSDGVHWKAPDLAPEYKGRKNYVITEPTAMGNVFIDPNAPPKGRWKLISDYDRRGIFLYSSADGWSFTRHKTAILPFRSGSQSNSYYDEQRQIYVSFNRSDLCATPSGKSSRAFVLSETKEIEKTWPFNPITLETTLQIGETVRLRKPVPHYLDNGPLTPSGFGVEYPIIFAHDERIDPLATDIYVPKAMKYPWAPDTYIAFPQAYFHYEDDGPITRQILYHPNRRTGSGTIETQVAVSRDGLQWRRYPRPVYVGIGQYGAYDMHQIYMAHGMVKRGDEIWQYFFGETRYHSSWLKEDEYIRAIYRTVQRFDGFVAAEAPYDEEGLIITRPLTFTGNRLTLNVDTDAVGYLQVGFLDETGQPIKGFALDQCVYINGDFIAKEVEWIKNIETFSGFEGKSEEELFTEVNRLEVSTDVSSLAGKTVQVVFRLRGARLYAMQFVTPNRYLQVH
ncbi:LamG domain-containing protein, partial [candidate division KSB1 bacterium]|nr:LamG domain-containing protein [candidate division KSB1 bacterium]